MNQMVLPGVVLRPSRAEIKAEVQRRMAGFWLRQQHRESRRIKKRLAEKATRTGVNFLEVPLGRLDD